MRPDERETLIAKYDERLAVYGDDPRTLGWNKPKTRLRFAMLLACLPHDTDRPLTLLDFGCGFGDLRAYCATAAPRIEYHGIDVNPKLVAIACARYPDAVFSVGDPLRDGLPRSYDLIVASGTHNFAVADQAGLRRATFALFARHASRGFAMNFLSDRVTFARPDNAYTAPEAALADALAISSRVVLRHDYMPFEFTLGVDLRTAYDDTTVYPDFADMLDDAAPSSTNRIVDAAATPRSNA